jgi:spermidine/putrescine transport system substrate-binding protein
MKMKWMTTTATAAIAMLATTGAASAAGELNI